MIYLLSRCQQFAIFQHEEIKRLSMLLIFQIQSNICLQKFIRNYHTRMTQGQQKIIQKTLSFYQNQQLKQKSQIHMIPFTFKRQQQKALFQNYFLVKQNSQQSIQNQSDVGDVKTVSFKGFQLLTKLSDNKKRVQEGSYYESYIQPRKSEGKEQIEIVFFQKVTDITEWSRDNLCNPKKFQGSLGKIRKDTLLSEAIHMSVFNNQLTKKQGKQMQYENGQQGITELVEKFQQNSISRNTKTSANKDSQNL